MSDVKLKIINEAKKEIQITYKGHSLKFRLNIRRSFTVLNKILEAYPNYMNIHSLDGILNDPNRAHSDLRIADGFANFLLEKKDEHSVMLIKLDLDKLFEIYKEHWEMDEFVILASSLRKNLSKKDQELVYKKFKGRCNLTGFRIYKSLKGKLFFKHALMDAYDHRRPLSKKGTNELNNWQLISKFANDEKNKICNICDGRDCEKCALAYPEKFDIIIPTRQSLKEIRNR